MIKVISFIIGFTITIFLIFANKDNVFIRKLSLKAKQYICTIVFLLLSFIFILLYVLFLEYVNISMGSSVLALFLVASWFISRKINWILSNGENILSIEDKNLCYIFSLIGAVITGIIFMEEMGNNDFCVLIDSALCIFIGVYFSMNEIYSYSENDIIKNLLTIFKNSNVITKKTCFWSLILIVISASNNAFLESIEYIFDSILFYLTLGMFIPTVPFIIKNFIQNKKI